jgi:hypothetical protein
MKFPIPYLISVIRSDSTRPRGGQVIAGSFGDEFWAGTGKSF